MALRQSGVVKWFNLGDGRGEVLTDSGQTAVLALADVMEAGWRPTGGARIALEVESKAGFHWARNVTREPIGQEAGLTPRYDSGTGSPKPSSPESGLGALLGIVFAGVALYQFAKAADTALTGFLKYKAEQLDASETEAIRRLENESESLQNFEERLDRADQLLESEDDLISIDQAALLLSSTLEAGVRALAREAGLSLDAESPEGMVAWAAVLHEHGSIPAQAFHQIRRHAGAVRNKVVHGDFEGFDRDDVLEFAEFVREFFEDQELIDSA